MLAGCGGAAPISQRRDEPARGDAERPVLVFKLGGTAKLPDEPDVPLPAPSPSNEHFADAQIAAGAAAYYDNCAVCHGGYDPAGPSSLRCDR